MNKRLSVGFLVLLLALLNLCSVMAAETPRMLAHDVYFELKDNSPSAQQRLIAACKKYLAEHPGIVWFDASARVKENKREVNDQQFDVALHILFKDKASHDLYQQAPRHHQFMAENSGSWRKVRVFDSYVMVTAHGDDSESKENHEHTEHAH